MRVVVLGSGTCVPRRRRGPAGYAVATDDYLILIDSGSGTLGRLARSGLDYRRLTHALYTHIHPDHTADLAPLLFATNYTPDFERRETLHLIGPPGFGRFVDQLAVPWPWIRPNGAWLRQRELADGQLEWPGLKVRALPVEHGDLPANAYRLEADGRSVVFSGDTRYCAAIVEIALGADLLIIEASLVGGRTGTDVHMTAAQAGLVAAEAGVSTVVLTHLYPACDARDMVALCREQFDGAVILGEDLLQLRVDDAGVTPVSGAESG